jgi:RND family efflux transporter MFP subunit
LAYDICRIRADRRRLSEAGEASSGAGTRVVDKENPHELVCFHMNFDRFKESTEAGLDRREWGGWAIPSRIMFRVLTAIGVLMTVLIAAGGWLFLPPTLGVARLIRGPAVQAVYATGTVEAGVTIRIAPQIGGRIIELKVDEGNVVKADDVLARLDDSDLRESVAELEARARYAEQQFERASRLMQTGATTREKLDQAQADVNATRHVLRRATEQLAFMSLRTPVPGTVIRRDGEIGDYIPVNQPVFYLAKAGTPLRISADVDEEDIPLVKNGQTVLIRSDAFPLQVFRGEVKDFTPKGDPIARSYRVRIALPQDTDLMIGMTAEVNIVTAQKQNVLLAPSSAVKSGKAWVVRDGRVVLVAVRVGITGRERTEVSGDIKDDDFIVVEPSKELQAGKRVRTRLQDQSGGSTTKGQTGR